MNYLITVQDDNEEDERCELGHNWYLEGEEGGIGPEGEAEGTFHLYENGERAATYFSLLAEPQIADVDGWQTVMQMKQTQPTNNGRPGG